MPTGKKMKYKILKYVDDALGGYFLCENENGTREKLDLFTDSSYKGFGSVSRPGGNYLKKYQSIIGKTIEVESIFPWIPLYFAKNVRLLKD